MNHNHPHQKLHIFFDAEGTLYVPRKAHDYSEFWSGHQTINNAKKIFKLDKDALKLLTRLKNEKIPMYVVSQHKKELLIELLEYFGIKDFFTDVLVTSEKGKRIEQLAKSKQIPLDKCLMIGDRYDLDIAPVLEVGGAALLIDREYNQYTPAPRIKNYDEVLKLITTGQYERSS
jgi:FMN phosphatase YigB (HAD superfamily)